LRINFYEHDKLRGVCLLLVSVYLVTERNEDFLSSDQRKSIHQY